MKPKELKLLISEGEGLSVEFKEKYTPRIAEDIVAFSNTKGGHILLGINDQGKSLGEALTNRLRGEITSLARNCEPHINIKKISQIGRVIAIEIAEGDEKPYSCSSGYFRRLDAVTQKMTQKEVGLLFRNAVTISYEERIHSNISWDDISKEKIKLFFKEAGIAVDKINPQDVLTSLDLAARNGIKNAGVLFFAREPRRHIFQCETILVSFKGTNRTDILDRKDVQDDLWTQYQEAMVFLKRHLSVRTEIKGLDRKDLYEVPLEALREAVANALIHRDYSIRGTSIMIEVHENRVIIKNPGGFPIGMSKEKLGVLSVRRNELIADIFARMHRVERMGSGFRRIRESMDAAGLPFPKISSDGFFIIEFERPEQAGKKGPERVTEKVPERVTENQRKIVEAISKNQHVTITELSKIVGISERKIKDNILKLKGKGLIRRIGPDKGGHWEVAG